MVKISKSNDECTKMTLHAKKSWYDIEMLRFKPSFQVNSKFILKSRNAKQKPIAAHEIKLRSPSH